MNQTWVGPLITAQGDGTAVTNTTSETTLLPAAAKLTLGANQLDVIGKAMRITAQGRISNVVTTPGNLTLKLKFGSTAVFTSGTMNLNVVAKTDVAWMFDLILVLRAIGASANFMGIGRFQSESVVGSAANTAGGNGSLVVPVSAPAVGSNFDSTTSQQMDLTATFSVSTATTSMQLHNFIAELLN